jgi:hypothetical protein
METKMGKVKQMAFDQEEKYIQKTIEEGGESRQEILFNIYKRDIIFHSQDKIEDLIYDYLEDNKP